MPMEKAKIINTEKGGETIEVMYNPPSLKILSSNSYADAKTPGKNQDDTQYLGNNNDILTVELFFDTTRRGREPVEVRGAGASSGSLAGLAAGAAAGAAGGIAAGGVSGAAAGVAGGLVGGAAASISADVRALVNPIMELAKMPVDDTGKKATGDPPKLIFAWGAYTFDCVLISADQTYDYFNAEGQAQRATLALKFRRVKPTEGAAAPVQATQVKAVKKETVKAGQDITSFCENPKDWRAVAVLNNMDNPNLVATGSMVGVMIITAVK